MARENYSFKKYQRELAKKKKKEEKIKNKLDKKNMQAVPAAADPGQAPKEDGTVV